MINNKRVFASTDEVHELPNEPALATKIIIMDFNTTELLKPFFGAKTDKLLDKAVTLENVIAMPFDILSAYVGKQRAEVFFAAKALIRRMSYNPTEFTKIYSSDTAFNILKPYFILEDEKEVVYAIYLNKNNRVIKVELIAIGGINACIMDFSIIFKKAMIYNSSAFIIAHNHPSGNLKPSDNDMKLSNKLKQIGDITNIDFLDCLIISKDKYLSFADEGYL